jgi:hypothetical protein
MQSSGDEVSGSWQEYINEQTNKVSTQEHEDFQYFAIRDEGERKRGIFMPLPLSLDEGDKS